MNGTRRFSDDKLEQLCDEFHACQEEEKDARAMLKQLARNVKCLRDSMSKHQSNLETLEKMLPRLDELLTRFSQAKGIFWFLTLVSGIVIAQAFGAFSRAVAYVKGLLS